MEGAAAWRLLTAGGGQWRRSGMDGALTGLDLAACLARPSAAGCDGEILELLLTMAEGAVIRAVNAARKE